MDAFTLTESQRQTYRRFAGLALPRHTSYPIASTWKPTYRSRQFHDDLLRSAAYRPLLSLYVHVPFCQRLCYYCACNKEIVPLEKRRVEDPGESFLEGLEIEADRFARIYGATPVRQVHWGGGSPTFLTPVQVARLWNILEDRFSIDRDAEIAVEVDPRVTTWDHLCTLRGLGFNRISLGIQDFDPKVQRAVNRQQPFEMVEQTVSWCRTLGFASINFDLIYGLPFQTLETMADTLDKTLSLGPDRIAFYRLAVIPEIFRWQNVFRHADLPAGDLSLELNLLAINCFLQAGFQFIGLDHFARPDEPLARALADGSLRRDFQGMTTGKSFEVLGMGPSAISQLDRAYGQNRKQSMDWRRAIEEDFATGRGLSLSDDDRLRREVMQQLYGRGIVDRQPLESRFGIDFETYFKSERDRLHELEEQGLVATDRDAIRLTSPLGRLLVRVVAAVFDAYLPATAFRDGLSAQEASRVG
jgi:oxygen-independent coproporphyrinogen-3 oxidase